MTDTPLTQCLCYHSEHCHFCEMDLVTDEREHLTEDEQWADYVLTIGGNRFHILAHAYCAEGQIGVERG
jgi:hypothetical protein